MAKKKVIVEGQVILDDKGSLKKITKGSRQADRALKGTAKTSSSSTKNFSKMCQGITGGLVPAYATLAANLFAITAVFAALKEAADLRVMREGMEQYAATTGIAMQGIAASLQQVTHMQLNYGEALKSTATLTAAGFSKDMILEMGTAARQASAALGHNFEDAFNRITKGIQKAEPELLDELGIILRLDQATRNYAIANKLAQDDLTLFQRTLAVHNEVISQATEKYGSLNKEIKVSGIVQLGTAFENVKKSALEGFAPIAEFFANVFQKNIALVIAVMITFGVSMLKAAGIGDMLGEKVTSWTTNAAARVNEAKVAQENYNLALQQMRMTMDEIKGQAAGGLQGIVGQKGLMKGVGDFEGRKRLARGQIGMIPTKLLKQWRQTAAGVEGITQNMTAKQLKAFHTMIDQILMKEKAFEREWKGGWGRMGMWAQVKMAQVKSAVAMVGSGIGTMVGGIGRLAGGLMSIVGKLAMFKMIWEMGKGLAKDAHKYQESMLKFVKKIPAFKGWADKMLETTESWREMREHSKVMGEQLERLETVNENIANQSTEVKTIADNWSTATSQLERYVMLGRLLKSIDFTAQIHEAASAYKTARDITEKTLAGLDKKMENVDVKSASEVTFADAKTHSKDRGILNNRFDFEFIDKQMISHYSKSALMIKNAQLKEAGKTELTEEAGKRWRQNWIDMHKIDANTSSVIANDLKNEMQSKEKLDAIVESMSGMIGHVGRKAKELKLGGVDYGVFRATYDTEMADHGDPALAAQRAETAWRLAQKPLVDFVGELDSLKSITEAYNKTANKLYKKTMPTGFGKQFNTLQDMQNLYAEGLKSKIMTKDTLIDEQQLRMFSSMGLLTEPIQEQVALAREGKKDSADILVTWESLFKEGGVIAEEQDRAYRIAWEYEQDITAEKLKQVNLQHAGLKLKGAMGKRYQYEYNVAKLESQMAIKEQELAKLADQTPIAERDLNYDQKVANINLANTGLQKQLEIMKKQETIQFKLTDMFQQGFENLFTSLVKGEEKLGEVFKKVTSQMLAQMAAMMAQQAALRAFGSWFPGMSSYLGGRDGGIFNPPGYRSFGGGGIASGSDSGYTATLHGTEAVVPLGNDRSIPVKLSGNAGTSNITVNVSTMGGQQTTSAGAGEQERKLGQMIAAAVQGELLDQQRPGGILSPYGDGGP